MNKDMLVIEDDIAEGFEFVQDIYEILKRSEWQDINTESPMPFFLDVNAMTKKREISLKITRDEYSVDVCAIIDDKLRLDLKIPIYYITGYYRVDINRLIYSCSYLYHGLISKEFDAVKKSNLLKIFARAIKYINSDAKSDRVTIYNMYTLIYNQPKMVD